ncbi:MAG: hypothetical protein WAJ93_09825, partial [Candidatus Nitrosopolaris sp.]
MRLIVLSRFRLLVLEFNFLDAVEACLDIFFFVLHQRCEFHNLTSPIEVKRTYARLIGPNKKHIDLHKVFDKSIIQNGVFEGRYRTTDLDSVSQALLGIGKYGRLNAGISDISSLPIEEQKRYVRRSGELAMLLAQYNNCLALRIMKIFGLIVLVMRLIDRFFEPRAMAFWVQFCVT